MKDRLKKLRENLKLTQKDFGARIGVSDKVVSKWERGVSAPDILTLKKISEIYFVGIEELIGSQRQEKAAFPARKIRKSVLYYSAFGAATLCFFATTAIFCILYIFALNGKVELYRPAGQLAVGFVPIAFGVILFCVSIMCSQIKFRAFPIFATQHTQGKTFNETLCLPISIDLIYSIYGKCLSLYYLIFQVWNSCNVAACLFRVNVVLRYMSHGVCVISIVLVTTVAGLALKRVEQKDKASAEIFKEIKAEKSPDKED